MRILHPIPIFDLPLPTTTIQKHPRERLPSQRSAGTGTLIPRDRFREVERRNTIAGIALPSPPPRGTIRGGGEDGGGRCTEIKIGSVDVTGRRGPTLSRLPPTFVNHAAESKTSARSMCPPRLPFEGRDDGPRRRRRRRRRGRRRRGWAYKQTITRETFGIHSPVRFFFSNPLHRAEASAWPDLRG